MIIKAVDNHFGKKNKAYSLTSKMGKSKLLEQRNNPSSPGQTASTGILRLIHIFRS